MSEQGRAPQITDDVVLTFRFPATTEEWADELLAQEYDVRRDENGELVVVAEVGGNTNALSVARSVLSEVEDFLDEANVDPMAFVLTAEPRERKDKW